MTTDTTVTVEVEDRGIGIPADSIDRIFERFYRVDRARNRATGGTGLGLSIVTDTMHRHGGRLELHSTEGRGTDARLWLPVSASPADRRHAGSASRAGSNGRSAEASARR